MRAIFEAILDHLERLGPVHVDAVEVGVFLKRDRKVAEVRPMSKCVSLLLALPRTVDDPRVSRRIRTSATHTVHFIRLHRVEDVDDQLKNWLTEAFFATTE